MRAFVRGGQKLERAPACGEGVKSANAVNFSARNNREIVIRGAIMPSVPLGRIYRRNRKRRAIFEVYF